MCGRMQGAANCDGPPAGLFLLAGSSNDVRFLLLGSVANNRSAKYQDHERVNVPLIPETDRNSNEPVNNAHQQGEIPISESKPKVLPG